MTLSSKQKSLVENRAGFTLMELIVVMAIVSIFFGAAMMMMSSPRLEKEIREAHHGIEDLALQARAMSYSYQQAFVIELREGEVRMMPLATPEDEIENELSEEMSTPASLKPLDSMSWPRVFKIDPKYTLWVRRWNSNNYERVTDNTIERWIHQPNSPCEPLAVQLISENGDALLSRAFHPLTAKATDEEMTIGNQ